MDINTVAVAASRRRQGIARALLQRILADPGVRAATLDVRVSKSIKLGPSKLELYADVQNVTDRENAEELVYNQNYTERRNIRGLPILPVLGARWER